MDPVVPENGTIEDVITGAIQEKLRLEDCPGHLVTEWAIVARTIDPDGKPNAYATYSDNLDEIMVRGLAAYMAAEADRWDEDDD